VHLSVAEAFNRAIVQSQLLDGAHCDVVCELPELTSQSSQHRFDDSQCVTGVLASTASPASVKFAPCSTRAFYPLGKLIYVGPESDPMYAKDPVKESHQLGYGRSSSART